MRTLLVGTTLVGALILTGCSSSATSSDASAGSEASSPVASVAAQEPLEPKAWIMPTPATDAEAQSLWCSTLEQIMTSIGSATPTRTGAQKTLNALATYDQLWTMAVDRGYVTNQEADVNMRYIKGYQEMVTLQADGKAADSPEIKAVVDSMNKLTNDGQSLFDSSTSKVTTLCGISVDESASASPSASPSAS